MSDVESSDEQLLQRFREQGDAAAIDRLLCRYHAAAVSVARARLRSAGDGAEDAVQEAFIRVVRACARFDPRRGAFAAWFYTVLRRVCIDALRKSHRRREGDRALAALAEPCAPAPDPGAHRLDDLLRSLTEGDREILVYRVVHGMTFQEIASAMELSVEATKKRAQRALRRLREEHAPGK